MGTKRKESQIRRLVRLTKAFAERETLLPCPACDRSGFKLVESAETYRRVSCNWCEEGLTDIQTVSMFARWERISKACQKIRHPKTGRRLGTHLR